MAKNKFNDVDFHNLYDLDMERAILASIIYSADNLSEIFDILSPFDFYLRTHGDIYDAMVKCLNENLPVETGFLKTKLGSKFDENVMSEIIGTNSILDVKKYANEVKEKSIKRSLVKIAHQIPSKVSDLRERACLGNAAALESFASGQCRSLVIYDELCEGGSQEACDNLARMKRDGWAPKESCSEEIVAKFGDGKPQR